MGLDMYLFKKTKGENEGAEVAYWRKANQVRQWFVDHAGYNADANCEEHPITKSILERLVSDCKTVLADHSKAEEVLPTQSGFFFGSTDYDDWYFNDLTNTVEQVEKVVADTDWNNEEVYYYEWW